jgi:Phosphotransferase enzyme family
MDQRSNPRHVERVGSTVRRPTAFWSPAVHDLLRHLETVDFPAPRLLEASGDVETLTWLPGDSGPWNGVWQDDTIVGLIDWDHARPADKLFDVAYALEYVAPFRDDEDCVRWLHYPEPPDRRRRIDVFCDAYGIAVPEDVVGQVAHQQRLVMQTCEALGRRGIEPQASWISDGHLAKLRAQIRWTESLTL